MADPSGVGVLAGCDACLPSGLVRGLQQLQLIKMTLKPAALDALAAAISSTPPEELLLEGLTLWQINLEDQVGVMGGWAGCRRALEMMC